MGRPDLAEKRLSEGKALCERLGWDTLACSRSQTVLAEARLTWLDFQDFGALTVLGRLPAPAEASSEDVSLDRFAIHALAIEILLGMEEPELAARFASSEIRRVSPVAGSWPALARTATIMEAIAAHKSAEKEGRSGVRGQSITAIAGLLDSVETMAPIDAAGIHVLLSEMWMDEAYDAAHHYVEGEFDYAASAAQVQSALEEVRAAKKILKVSSYHDLSLRADGAELLARLHQMRIDEPARDEFGNPPKDRLAIYTETNEPLMRAMAGRRRIIQAERFAHFALLWTDWGQAVSFAEHAEQVLNTRPEDVSRALDNDWAPMRLRLADERALGLAGVFTGWGSDSSIREGYLATQQMFSLGAGEMVRLQIAATDADQSRARQVLGDIQTVIAERRMVLSSAMAEDGVALPDMLGGLYTVSERLAEKYEALLDVIPEDARLDVYSLPDRYGVVDSLREGEAFVQIVNGEDIVHVFVILADKRIGWAFETREYRNICQLAGRMRRHLPDGGRSVCPARWGKTGTDLNPDISFDADAAYELYQLLFEPVMPAFNGVDTIIISVSGPLASVPLTTLLQAPPPPGAVNSPEAMRELPWFVNRFSFLVVPDAETFVRLRMEDSEKKQAKAVGKAGFAVIGAPCLGYERELGCPDIHPAAGKPRPLMRGAADLSRLDPLPGAREELDALASKGGPAVLKIVGGGATERAVRKAKLGQFEKVFISTHVVTPNEIGVHEGGLVLSRDADTADPPRDDDGFLSESELLAGKLEWDADLVVVAGCNSGAPAASGGYYALPSLSGLAKAFMANGARQLVLTQSPLDDRTSLEFTSALAAADGEYHKVLREVMLQQIQSGDPYPQNWASFVAVGH